MVTFALLPAAAASEDWDHWRGPTRDGHVRESSGWQPSGWPIRETWRLSVGAGASSPLVVAGRIYVMGWTPEPNGGRNAGTDQLWCLDASSGKPLWKKTYRAPRYGRLATGDQGLYSGPTSTPEFDRATGLLFTLSNDGMLQAWDTQSRGELVWKKSLYDTYDIAQRPKVGRSGRRDYGFTSSPLALPNQLIVEIGAADGTLAGFDKTTGRQLWTSEARNPAGHTGGIVPITVDGTSCVAVHHFDGLLVSRIDPAHEGETVAQYPWRTEFANNIATPAVRGNNIVLTSSYNQHRIARIRITLSGGAQLVWELSEASKVCSPVIVGKHVYWAWRQVYCVDFETGDLQWKGGRLGDAGSLIATDDQRLIAWVSDGDLRLFDSAERSPDNYRQLAELTDIGDSDAWPHVVLANRRLLCKDRRGTLVAFELPR